MPPTLQAANHLFWQKFTLPLSVWRSENQQGLEEPETIAPTPDLGSQQADNMTDRLLPVVQFDVL